MKLRTILLLMATLAGFSGCGSDSSSCTAGEENCSCKESNVCNGELTCASNTCVDLNTADTDTGTGNNTDTGTGNNTDTGTGNSNDTGVGIDTSHVTDTGTGIDTNVDVDVPGMWIVGSHPEYQWSDVPPEEVPYSSMTHLFLSFLEPAGTNGNYTMEVTGWGPQTMEEWTAMAREYIRLAHEANVKVLVDLGGMGGADEPFAEACRSESNNTALASTIVTTLQEIGFDGVDLDWEGGQYTGECAATILKALRAAWPTGIIATAVGPMYGPPAEEIAAGIMAAADDIDALMMMTYIPPDQTWTWWVVPVPTTPLHGTDTPWGNKQDYSIDRDRTVWTNLGMPASKIVMGIGGFGVVWADTNGDGLAPNAPYTNFNELATDPRCTEQYVCDNGADGERSPINCGDNKVTQSWLDGALAEANGKLTLQTDAVGGTTYWASPAPNDLATVTNPCGGGTIDVGSIYYESAASILLKKQYIEQYGMRGFEIWTLSQLKNASGQYPVLDALNK